MGKLIFYTLLIFTFAFSSLFITNVSAKEQDSLLLLIEHTTDDKKKVDLFNQLANIHRDTAFNKAIAYTDKAYQLAQKINYPFGKAKSLYHKGRSLALNNQFQKALDILQQSSNIFESLPNIEKEQASLLVLQGWVNDKLSKYYVAITNYEKAFQIYNELNDELGKARTLLNIGTIHTRVGDKVTAISYFQQAKNGYKKLENKIGLVYCYNNIGYIHELNEAYESALVEYQKALKLAEETKLLRMHSSILANTGISNMKLGRYEKGLTALKKGQKIDLKLKDEISLAYSKLYIAKIQFLQSKEATNISTLKKTYQTGVKLEDIELQRLSATNLSDMYQSMGLFQEALEQNLLAATLRDSIVNQDIQLKIKSLELKKQFELTQKKLELEKKEMVFKNSLAYQAKIRNILLCCLSLLLFGGFILYRTYKTTLATKEELLIKNNFLTKTEERLAQNNTELKKHIELNVELEQFASIASHDIKAPLRTIASFIGILKLKFYEQAAEREKTCFDFVETSAKSLNLLVDDLLEFSRSNNQALKVEQLAFGQLLEEVKQNLNFSITNVNGTVCTNNCNFLINADQIKLKQILQNLLSNALKFKSAERDPIIEIATREDEKLFYISVKDNGIGITEEYFEKVFEKFARLNSQSKFEGSGLGLSICAKYINKHGGTIWIERNEEHGVKFTFTISKALQTEQQKLANQQINKAIVEGKSYPKPKIEQLNIQ